MPFIPLEVYANNPSTTVSSGGTTAPAGGTVETWTVASSSSFPAVEIGATQFHVADPALPSEIITVANISGTTWTVTRGAESTAPVAHAAGFTVVQVVTAEVLAGLAYPAWQFPVQAYGAQGDGKIGTGGTGTSGTATFTDSGASFVNAAAPQGDVGKVIIVNQGTSGTGTQTGTNQNPFCGTITAVNSATSVTLSGNLAATCASAPYIYGTDDAAAINAAVAAAKSFAVAHNYKAQVVFEPLNYMLAAMTQTITGGAATYNTHIPIPYGAQYGQKLVIDFVGVGDASEPDYWETAVPSLQGTCLVSAVFSTGQPDGTFGQSSVIGGPIGGTDLSPGTFANTLLNINGITVVTPWNSQMYGVNGTFLAQMNVPNGSYLAFAPVNFNFSVNLVGGPYLNSGNIPGNGVSAGWAFPGINNNDNNTVGQLTAEGCSYGLIVGEHFVAQRMFIAYCNIGLYTPTSAPVKHGMVIDYFSCENCNYAISCPSVGGAGAGIPVFIASLDVENVATAHIQDVNSQLYGTVCLSDTTTGNVNPVVSGAQKLIVLDAIKHAPGPWSGAPAVPASGTASTNTQQNLAYRYATLYLSATTITAVFTGVAATGLTPLTGQTQASGGQGLAVRVPPGHYWSATYTGTLTAVWVLE